MRSLQPELESSLHAQLQKSSCSNEDPTLQTFKKKNSYLETLLSWMTLVSLGQAHV